MLNIGSNATLIHQKSPDAKHEVWCKYFSCVHVLCGVEHVAVKHGGVKQILAGCEKCSARRVEGGESCAVLGGYC